MKNPLNPKFVRFDDSLQGLQTLTSRKFSTRKSKEYKKIKNKEDDDVVTNNVVNYMSVMSGHQNFKSSRKKYRK